MTCDEAELEEPVDIVSKVGDLIFVDTLRVIGALSINVDVVSIVSCGLIDLDSINVLSTFCNSDALTVLSSCLTLLFLCTLILLLFGLFGASLLLYL
ncbi:Uncharacterised protein [Chlamydia trachomatis]|nr:Uncharacterised protein [Chlamydia trachomatis]